MIPSRPSPWGRRVAFAATALALALPVPAQSPSFTKGTLAGASPKDPTSLAFGPDGRLYVTERYGRIHAYTIDRVGEADYVVTDSELLEHVYLKPNRDDDGNPDPATVGRQCTGILATGTAQNPVLFVTSSDPRVAVGFDAGLDTNSGILTRLTWNGTSWDELDLVRGLPRCEENHAANGMVLDPVTNTLYLTQGGNTNMGAPSNSFGQTPEYALAAAILTIDLDAIGETTYDLPTLDDPSRPNTGPGGADENDPFGGNDGANQAVIVDGGPVQVWAPGFRNAYDIVSHSNGWLYTVDNGPNAGWGGPPDACTNDPQEDGSAHYPDGLHKLGLLGGAGGYYGGHPNPFRGSSAATINGQSPIPMGSENPAECTYLAPGPANGALKTWLTSTNGLCEYTASNFGGAMQGDLLTVGYGSSKVERVQLAGDGSLAASSTLFTSVAAGSLDVVARGDGETWPGTIWVAALWDNKIVVYEPADIVLCTGDYSLVLDEDEDGYSNADEIDNGVDPCSAGDLPPDADGDFLSDLNDPDDDDDGLADVVDPFARDAANGLGLLAPFHYGWGVGDPGTGFFGLGFTGLATNGTTDYLDQYTASNVIAGGAAGKVTVDHVDAGDALGAQNDQRNAFQLGVDVGQAGPFTVRTSVAAPFFDGVPPVDGQSHGLYLGTGTQDDYVKVVLAAGGGTGALQVVVEEGGVVSDDQTTPAAVLGSQSIELSLSVDPGAATVQPAYRADGGALMPLGSPRALPASLAGALAGSEALAVGIVATAGPTGPDYAATWDFLEVTQDSTARALVSIGPQGADIDASTFDAHAFHVENTSPAGQRIEALAFDLSSAAFPDMVFDPDGLAGDSAFKGFTPDSGAAEAGLTTHAFAGDHDGGYDVLTVEFDDFDPGEVFTFSVDVDPTSIAGSSPPGPNDSGSVSGLELTGSTVTVAFDDGATFVGQTFRAAGSLSESVADLHTELPSAPRLRLVGHGAKAVLGNANQTLRVTGDPGDNVRVLVAEGGLYLAGVPGGGFDVDPFEANSVVAATELTGTIGVDGLLELPYTFGQTDSASGIHHLTAVVVAPDGSTGRPSPVLIAELAPAELVASPSPLAFGSVFPSTSKALDVLLDNEGVASATITSVEVIGDREFALGAVPALPLELEASAAAAAVEVVFTPSSAGPASATLLVHHDGEDSPLAVGLQGQGSAPDFDVLYRVNCGGPQLAATDATQPWSADTEASPSAFVNAAETNATGDEGSATPHSSVPSAAPAGLFSTDRTDAAGGAEMSWAFPLPANTYAEVRLYVAETSPAVTGAGQRVFDVTAEGQAVSGVDAWADAGPDLGFVRTAVVAVADGALDVDFAHVVGDPSIHAIEVRRAGPFVASRALVSATHGGTQDVHLNAPPFAGQGFLLLSSVSGTTPGFPLGTVHVPLNLDSMVIYSITTANAGPYTNSLGALDVQGRAVCSFTVPTGLGPSFVGIVFSHAAVVFDTDPLASTPFAVELELTE